MRNPLAVVAGVWCTTNVVGPYGFGALRNHQTHYWALRQQARYLFALLVGEPEVRGLPVVAGWLVVAPSLVVGCGV